MKNCQRCGRFTKTVLCKDCKNLKRAVKQVDQLQRQLGLANVEIDGLKRKIRHMKRYSVTTNTVWPDLTWEEAVKQAEDLYKQGIHFVSIRDGNRVVRKLERKDGNKVWVTP